MAFRPDRSKAVRMLALKILLIHGLDNLTLQPRAISFLSNVLFFFPVNADVEFRRFLCLISLINPNKLNFLSRYERP